MPTFCPATMCPLFAADGSPWTGDKNGECKHDHEDCAWWSRRQNRCEGSQAASQQITELSIGGRPLVIGKSYREHQAKATTYDCARAKECQWQLEQKPGDLCPPREALRLGLDPRACAY